MNDENKFMELIHSIHIVCAGLVAESTGKYLPVAGNIAVFCQNDSEYERFSVVGCKLTQPSANPNQKYFRLKESITIADSDMPAATYEYLYVRKPATDSPEAGDIDFTMDETSYYQLKQMVIQGEVLNASVYERPGWDMVELKCEGTNGLSYICTQSMADKVRVKF